MIKRHIETVIGNEDTIPNCKFPGCKNKIALIEVDYKFFDFCIERNFEEDLWESKKKQLRDYINNSIVFCSLRYCEEHESQQFQHILDAIYEGKEDEKPSLAAFWTQAINNYEWSMIYTVLCDNSEDTLLKSLIGMYDERYAKADDKQKLELERNSELIWFTDQNYYSIPVRWKRDFVVDKYFGAGTTEQGKFNGPDFILRDTVSGETYGFEIFELNPTMFKVKNIRDLDKFIDNMYNQVNAKRGGSLYRNFKTACYEVQRKTDKWNKYEKVDKKTLGIIMNNNVPDEWYYLLELMVNNIPEFHNFFYWIYFL